MNGRWFSARLTAFAVLNQFEAWLNRLTEPVDRPGPSTDDIDMQPEMTP